MSETFDAIIVGAGQAGPPLAGRLTNAGMTVALIERHLVGGTCVNTGCMPTKALVASAYAVHLARRASEYGVMIDGAIGVDMKAVHARSRQVTLNARSSDEKWMKGMEGLTFLRGHATFEGPQSIRVGGRVLTAPRIFLNVGGRALVPDMPGLADVPYHTNSGILDIDTLPRHLIVIGGSYIGLEFAQMFRRFGSRVTVVERGPRLVGREDEDVSEAIRGILEAEDIAVHCGVSDIRFSPHADGASVSLDGKDVVGSDVLIAIGRRPNTGDLGLDKAGIVTNPRGYIIVDDSLETSVPGIWALGDCNGRGAFTHTSYNDFEIVAANLLDGEQRKVSDRIPAYALYIDPPLGRVGMGESEARMAGHAVTVSTRPMTRVGRAVEKGETQGFMKIVADAETKKILGAAILGTGGDEAIHGILDMMNADQPWPVLQWAVPIHPTVSELIPTILGGLKAAEANP